MDLCYKISTNNKLNSDDKNHGHKDEPEDVVSEEEFDIEEDALDEKQQTHHEFDFKSWSIGGNALTGIVVVSLFRRPDLMP